MRRMSCSIICGLGSLVVLLTISLPLDGEALALACTSPDGPITSVSGTGLNVWFRGELRRLIWSIKGQLPSGLRFVDLSSPHKFTINCYRLETNKRSTT